MLARRPEIGYTFGGLFLSNERTVARYVRAPGGERFWERLPDMPMGHREGRAFVLDGAAYLLGGFARDVATNIKNFRAVDRFTFADETWDQVHDLPNLPSGFRLDGAHTFTIQYGMGFGTPCESGDLFRAKLIPGGVRDKEPGELTIVDVGTSKTPFGRADGAAFETGYESDAGAMDTFDIGYVAGGSVSRFSQTSESFNLTDEVISYDPDVDNWKNAPPMPIKNRRGGWASLNGKAFVFGGRRDVKVRPGSPAKTRKRHRWSYSFDGEAWRRIADIPINSLGLSDGSIVYGVGREAGLAAVTSDGIHFVGGVADWAIAPFDGAQLFSGSVDKRTSEHQLYHPDTDTWTSDVPVQVDPGIEKFFNNVGDGVFQLEDGINLVRGTEHLRFKRGDTQQFWDSVAQPNPDPLNRLLNFQFVTQTFDEVEVLEG